MAKEQASNGALFDESPAAARPRARQRLVLLVCADLLLVRQLQRGLGLCDVRTAVAADMGSAAAAAADCDAIVVDLGAADAQRQLRQVHRCSGVPLLAVLGPGSSAITQEQAIACGAQLLVRPISRGALAAALRRAFAEQRHRALLAYHAQRESRHAGLAHLIGESAPMLHLRAGLRLLLDRQRQALSEPPRVVLLHGECGTGKLCTARALHGDGPRSGAAFVRFDARGMISSEIEARLFGCLQQSEPGLLDAAEGGTLYIRDITDIPLHLQARLAEWIETAGWAGAGDLLLIAGSRCSPEQPAAAAALWPGLAAMMAASTFAIPPLRERGDDVCVIGRFLMRALAERRGLCAPSWGRTVRDALLRHRWPGNVRELRHAMERALFVQRDGAIEGADLRLDLPHAGNARAPAADLELGRIEHDALTRALGRARGNVSKAARLLGITRDTLRYRMIKQGLSRAAGHVAGIAPP